MDAHEDIIPIDWDASLDADEYLQTTPSHITVKGMFIQSLVDAVTSAGMSLEGRSRYSAFKDYPLTELMEVEVAAAGRLFPEVPLRRALRRFGWSAFPTLMSSMIGRVIFAPVGNNLRAAIKLAARGYRVSISHAKVSVEDHDDAQSVYVRLGDVFNFADSYQVGVFEGAVRHYGREPSVTIRRRSRADVDLLVRWR